MSWPRKPIKRSGERPRTKRSSYRPSLSARVAAAGMAPRFFSYSPSQPPQRNSRGFPRFQDSPAATRSATGPATVSQPKWALLPSEGIAPRRRLTVALPLGSHREHSRNFEKARNAPPLRSEDPGSRAGRFREGRLRWLRSYRPADAGGPIESRSEPRGEGSRPQRAAAVPRLREEGASGCFDQVAGAGRVSGAKNRSKPAPDFGRKRQVISAESGT